ncbi:MAG: hypothetical protein BGO05_12125 [Rhizobiales bacterium 63-7]|nr:hypothetical protein [Hyphomicrobiales bacterium]OJU67319.1 MAG: hypothetical protein BGO05_12125 [Rhizobiales bacterium 63-7]
MVKPPDIPEDHPDRMLACEQAMEPVFLDVMAAAMASGWIDIEVVTAINTLADNYMLAKAANAETTEALVIARAPRP